MKCYLLAILLLPFQMAIAAAPLLPAARQLQAAYSAWKKQPTSAARCQEFINAFPATKSIFLAIFYPADFRQLYDGHEYFTALERIGNRYPSAVMQRCITLAKTHPMGSDAIGYLHEATMNLARKQPQLFAQKVQGLPRTEQRELFRFLADVEGIRHYPDYDALMQLMADKGFADYVTELQQAKQCRLRQPIH